MLRDVDLDSVFSKWRASLPWFFKRTPFIKEIVFPALCDFDPLGENQTLELHPLFCLEVCLHPPLCSINLHVCFCASIMQLLSQQLCYITSGLGLPIFLTQFIKPFMKVIALQCNKNDRIRWNILRGVNGNVSFRVITLFWHSSFWSHLIY